MKKSNIIYLLFVVIISFAGCTEKGDTGPKGDKGDTGATGSTGNANVTTSNYTVTAWGSAPFQFTFTPTISSSTVANGAVLAYVETGLGWSALPYIYPQGGNVDQYYRGFFDVNSFTIKITNSDGSTPSSSSLLPLPCNFKIVVIPGRFANPNVNVNNYEEVKAAYNLKD